MRAMCDCGACRTCEKREYLRRYQAENREHLREYQRLYRIENAERLREQRRGYREANADEIRATKQRYFQANRERIAEERRTRDRETRMAQAKDWAKRNPDKRAAILRRDKARRRNVPFTDLGDEYARILIHDPCSYCGAPAESIDHIDPVVAGGTGDWDNLTGACLSCNSSKHATPLLQFMAR